MAIPPIQHRLAAVASGDTSLWLPSAPRRAATVVLLRGGSTGLEVFLMKRAASMKAAPGMFVFPGGGVEAGDGPVEDPLTLRRAALRELHEETGLLIKAAERMRSFARWVTPEVLPHRHDTEFFALPIAQSESPGVVGAESEHADWFTPKAALADPAVGLLPPTSAVLHMLADVPDPEQAVAKLAVLPVRPLMPAPVATASGITWAVVDAETRAEVSLTDFGLPADWRPALGGI